MLISVGNQRAYPAARIDCPLSLQVSETLTGAPPEGWSVRTLRSAMNLSDVQFSEDAPEDGKDYRLTDDKKIGDGNTRFLILQTSASSDSQTISLYYKFDAQKMLWAICRYSDSTIALVRQFVGIQQCRVNHRRRDASVTLEGCE
jgi:hypothetical protein